MTKEKTGVWIVITVVIFILFWWLFNMAISEIALPFAIGITVILVSGLIIGRLLYNLWSRSFQHLQPRAFSHPDTFIHPVLCRHRNACQPDDY